MNTQLTILSVALATACGAVSQQALAVTPPSGAVMSITIGVPVFNSLGDQINVSDGSYFGMDTSGNSSIGGAEKVILANGNVGITIGKTTTAGSSHTGLPTAGDSNEVDAPWNFFGNTGSDFFTVMPVGLSATTVDFSGWTVTWNFIPAISMGTNAWQPGNCPVLGCDPLVPFVNGQAQMTWSGVLGDPYTLVYAATVPNGDVSGFGNVQYFLHLEGFVTNPNPPVAAAFNASAASNSTQSINVAANVTDADANLDLTSVVISNSTACATITDNNDGTVTFPVCPVATYTFDYTISDTVGSSTTATVTVNVSADPPPNTQLDNAAASGTTPVNIDVLANDTDTDATTVAIATMPSRGMTSVNGVTGVVTYTANAAFAGADTFTYTVMDGSAQASTPTTVNVAVSALNSPASDGTYTAGATAVTAGSTSGVVTAANIGVTDNGSGAQQAIAQACIGGCFDFEITGFIGDASVVLPLTAPLPTPATGETLAYRKLVGGIWSSFDTSGNNVIASAPGTVVGTDVTCPQPSSTSYTPGLFAGNSCLKLTIVDGGPNDADATANGTVVDPGGAALVTNIDTRTAFTDGCSVSGKNGSITQHLEWLLVACFVAALGLLRRKKHSEI